VTTRSRVVPHATKKIHLLKSPDRDVEGNATSQKKRTDFTEITDNEVIHGDVTIALTQAPCKIISTTPPRTPTPATLSPAPPASPLFLHVLRIVEDAQEWCLEARRRCRRELWGGDRGLGYAYYDGEELVDGVEELPEAEAALSDCRSVGDGGNVVEGDGAVGELGDRVAGADKLEEDD
jgi:hypothetical protein